MPSQQLRRDTACTATAPDTPPQLIQQLGTQLEPTKPVISFLDQIKIEIDQVIKEVTFVAARCSAEVAHLPLHCLSPRAQSPQPVLCITASRVFILIPVGEYTLKPWVSIALIFVYYLCKVCVCTGESDLQRSLQPP